MEGHTCGQYRQTVSALEPLPDLRLPHPAQAAPVELASQTPALPIYWQLTLKRLIDLAVVSVLFFTPAYLCLRSSAIFDTDFGWHLRTGEWITAHHAIPHTEPFSAPIAGAPWAAYSWLFELLNYQLFHHLGTLGLLVYTAALLLLITTAVFALVRSNRQHLPAAAMLAFACMYAMGHLFTPRPWLFSILFFTLELHILQRVRRTGSTRPLLWLPLLFAVWANIHIQFVYGLFILGLALLESLASSRFKEITTRAAWRPLAATLLCASLATLVNPYGPRVYSVALGFATQSGALDTIGELQAIPFRDLMHYEALLFALASAGVLGWQRRWLSFEGALLFFAAFVSFRSQRDAWVIAIAGAAILSQALPRTAAPDLRTTSSADRIAKYLAPAAFAIVVCLLALAFRSPDLSESQLRERQATQLPVGAVDFIRTHGYSGPIFNDFNWGGYLIWNLHQPVTIDGRQNVYGDQRIQRSVATWSGAPGWQSDPDLRSAHLVIGPAGAVLTQLLRSDPGFQLAYQDKVAAVFVARP